MTQAEKNKIIAELQYKLAEAEKIKVDEPKRWKPAESKEYHKLYWVVTNSGTADYACWNNDACDNWLYLTDNCFKTKEEAEEHKKQIEYTARYKNYIEEHSEPIDWKDKEQYKYYSAFDYMFNRIDLDMQTTYKVQGIICASSKQIIEDAINEIGEDNFKKYVLGVK